MKQTIILILIIFLVGGAWISLSQGHEDTVGVVAGREKATPSPRSNEAEHTPTDPTSSVPDGSDSGTPSENGEEAGVPIVGPDAMPDPNDPDAPEILILHTEDSESDVTYVRYLNPEEGWTYIPEDEVPLEGATEEEDKPWPKVEPGPTHSGGSENAIHPIRIRKGGTV